MKVAAAAAVVAALVLGLAVGGVLGRTGSAPPADTIRLESGSAVPPPPAASPTPSETPSDDSERVHMRVNEEPFDDKGGERRDAERGDRDNSGRGSENSGSGRDDGD
ncbi:MAG TPA: hypothetical protein VHL54_09210 [Actinomycetota bacterium]|nr:hypothetical protein [Actinomycetota bacterium]